MESARVAKSGDLELIAGLAADTATELGHHRGGQMFFQREGIPGTDIQQIREALGRTDSHLVVGEFFGCILGYGLAQIEGLADGAKLARVHALVVLEAARGVGIGEAMMKLLVEKCSDDGCTVIDSLALPGDRHTKNFFESFGLKARLLTVSKQLSPVTRP